MDRITFMSLTRWCMDCVTGGYVPGSPPGKLVELRIISDVLYADTFSLISYDCNPHSVMALQIPFDSYNEYQGRAFFLLKKRWLMV